MDIFGITPFILLMLSLIHIYLKVIKEEEFSVAIDFAPCKCMLVSDDEEALVSLEGRCV